MSIRGFILQPSYRIHRQGEGRRPVVHLYGRLEDGATFLVKDDRETPHFYVRAMDGERAGSLGAAPLTDTGFVALGSELPLRRVEVPTPPDTPALRDRLHAAGIPTYEADVRFAMRYLMNRGLKGSVEIDGEPQEDPRSGVDRVFRNPELRPARWALQPSVLSIDIETDPRARRLLSVALHGCGVSEVLLFCPQDYSCPEGAQPFAKERDLLAAFCERVRQLDPDVITGWNVIDFDLTVLLRMAEGFQLPFELGRGAAGGGGVRIRPGRSAFNASQASIPGRVVLDGPQMLRGAFIKMEQYSLDHVARQILGEGKIHSGGDRARQIVHDFKHERERFVEYNRTDARLVADILDRLGLVDLAVERSLLTGMPLDRVSSSIAAFDFLYLSELTRRRIAAPTVGAPGHEVDPHTGGGHVLEPAPGLYENVLVFDFQSLYPSLIRTFQIDPLGYLPGHHAFPKATDLTDPKTPIVAPNGAAFRRDPGILPRLLDELMPRREAAKKAGDKVASQAIKILMNSFYGVLGTPACRFHNGAIATAITAFGQELLLWTRDRIEGYGHRVLYGDTDSLFLEAGEDSPEEALGIGEALVERLNGDLAEHVRQRWGVESRLQLELEKLYLRLFLPPMRHSSVGARKRYVGLMEQDGEKHVVFTGMEVVRRDWTELARRVQRELYRRLFLDLPVEAYLKQVVREVRAGEHDDLLVYLKGLGKDLDDYTAGAPPHVVAARKMSRDPGRLVAYVITHNGPEPAEERESPLDHDHYVQKQIRPVAEPVLQLLELEFDKVIGDDRQLELF